MYLKTVQQNNIVDSFEVISDHFDELNGLEKEVVTMGLLSLIECTKNHNDFKKKTTKRVNEKRKVNKNYGR